MVYKNVDERKNSIRDLEKKKRETLEDLNKLRETWGASLLSRLEAEDSDRFAGELGQRRHFLETIAAFKGRIQALEDGRLRLRDLEKELAEKDKTAAEKAGALKELYIGLGEIALQNDSAFAVEDPLKAQADSLAARIGAQQEKLAELEEGKNHSVFSWIGNNTKGALIRSRLSKSQADLSRIYGSTGEQFFAALEREGDLPAGDSPARIRALRQELSLLKKSSASLREERGMLRESLGMEGNFRNFRASKKIRETEQLIKREQEQLASLYGAFGQRLCVLFAGSETSEAAGESAWLQGEDKNILARARQMEGQIAAYEAGIEKLRASIRIDEERNAIDKMKRSILSHRQRIAAGENAIAGLEKQIAEANRHIEELMKLFNNQPGY
jgi:regulator of replication initiation timing